MSEQTTVIVIMGSVVATCTGAILNFGIQGWREKKKKRDDKIDVVDIVMINLKHLEERIELLESSEACCIDDKTCEERRKVLDDKINALCVKTKRDIDRTEKDVKATEEKIQTIGSELVGVKENIKNLERLGGMGGI